MSMKFRDIDRVVFATIRMLQVQLSIKTLPQAAYDLVMKDNINSNTK